MDLDTTGNPGAQLLNMTELLPKEVLALFERSGGLPDMLLSRQYRGQKDNAYIFEALFGRTNEGVVFQGTFEGEYNVAALAGSELGCELGLPEFSPLHAENGLLGTLDWDVVTTVSEKYPTIMDDFVNADPSVAQYVTTMTNVGCGSSKTRGGRWSMKPYNLEVTPCTYTSDPDAVWASDGSCSLTDPEETPDDAVFATGRRQMGRR